MSGLSGDFAALDKFVRAFERLANEGADKISDAIAERAEELINEGFETSTSPDGARWAPTKAGNKPLATMVDSVQVLNTGRGFVVQVGVPYGRYHQTGTSRMPARPFMPDGRLPARWEDEFWKEADAAFRRFFQ